MRTLRRSIFSGRAETKRHTKHLPEKNFFIVVPAESGRPLRALTEKRSVQLNARTDANPKAQKVNRYPVCKS